jgi:putative ABC transport system permease protein
MTGLSGRARRVLAGDAGPAPALVLAGVAVIIAFIAVAGPRALTVAGNSATRQAVAAAPVLDTSAVVTGDLHAAPGPGVLSGPAISRLTTAFAAALPLPGLFPAGQRWASASLPLVPVLNPAPSAVLDSAPQLEVAYRQGLAAYCRVIRGSLPAAPAVTSAASRHRPGSVTLGIAVTRAVAARFSLHVGSVLDLGQVSADGPDASLRVDGIIQPTAAASAFWVTDPLLSHPAKAGSPTKPFWTAGAFLGPGDLTALAAAYAGQPELLTWFFPLSTSLTSADVTQLESGISALAASTRLQSAQAAMHLTAVQHVAVSTGLADGLAIFSAQWRDTARTVSILSVGLFAAGLILLLICASLAVEAYRYELALVRVRGGSLAQLARRMLARSCCTALPAAVAGAALAIALLPGAGSTASWVLGALTTLAAILAMPVLAVLSYRRRSVISPGRGDDVVTATGSLRRLVAELAVALVAAAAIADVRLRGAGTSSTAPYLSASVVLVAVVVWLLANRAYRVPLRVLSGIASGRRGPVSVIGLARAAAARAGSVVPALALLLTLTLAVFGAMVMTSISTGQQAGSWSQVGADATVAAPGTQSVTAAELRALRQVPGVRQATAVFSAPDDGSLGAMLEGQSQVPVGLAVVEPTSYAAYSAQTPWPDFPAKSLAKPAAGHTTAVPVLATAGLAARVGSTQLRLEYFGGITRVRIVGTIGTTAAMPSGGSYVVVPAWAEPRLPSIPNPSTAMLAGSGISVPALQATVNKVLRGGKVRLRSQVLAQLTRAPALHLSEQLYLAGALAAAALSVFAVLFSIAGSARSRAGMTARLTAIGMARRQAVILGCTDAVPLLSVAIIGTAVATAVLIAVIGPVLGLNVFTGSTAPVALQPTWAGAIIPLAGAAALAIAVLALDGTRAGRRDIGAAIRQEEAD